MHGWNDRMHVDMYELDLWPRGSNVKSAHDLLQDAVSFIAAMRRMVESWQSASALVGGSKK